MSKELVKTMLEALTDLVDGLRSELPPNSVGEGDWLDTMPMTFLEGGKDNICREISNSWDWTLGD